MLTLITMRHAKSGWDDPGIEDRDRPLSDRGRRDAPRIGQWLHNAAPLPDLILCSSAQRTLETAQAVAGQLDGAPEPIPRDDLYMARSDRLLSVLRAATGGTVMVIAHNGGIGDFAARMVRDAPEHERFADYPTAATCVMEFDAETWAEVRPGTGRVTGFVVPGDLEGVVG